MNKTIEFIINYGWEQAKDLAYRDKTSVGYLSVDYYELDQELLKRLVESYELVEKFGGLTEAKKRLEQADLEFSLLVSFRKEQNVYDYVLKQAIEDVESVTNINNVPIDK